MQKVLAEYTDKYPIIVRKLDPEASSNKEVFIRSSYLLDIEKITF